MSRLTTSFSFFQNATVIAESMVKKFGMSDKVGFRVHRESDQYFGSSNDYGPATTELIDNEIKRLLQVGAFKMLFISILYMKLQRKIHFLFRSLMKGRE